MGFKKGEGGRPKGAKNKLTREMRELLEGEVSRQGPEGFRKWSEEHPTEFWKIAARLLPSRTKIAADNGYQWPLVIIDPTLLNRDNEGES
jgi:hypothetical protein